MENTTRKNVISRRYYPVLHGKVSTHYSYRSFYVGGDPIKGSADHIIGTCDGAASNGWVKGVKGAYAARTADALKNIQGFRN
jgi:hypothetical protein